MATVTEIAPDIYRITTYIKSIDLQFNQFLANDEEPLLLHSGLKALFPATKEAVASVVDPTTVRWIAFSHFEADECGALNDWLALAPESSGLCTLVAKLVSVDDVASRPAKGLPDNASFSTGKFRYRMLQTPHVPHCWEAGVLFEETTGTLFCSDIGHQNGDVATTTDESIIEKSRAATLGMQQTPLHSYMPYTHHTAPTFDRLADLQPKTLAIMHGSAYIGDGARELRGLAVMLREVLGPPI